MERENQERDASLSKLAAVIFVLLYAAAGWLGLELYDPPLHEPFDNPPWYFIRQDAVRGLVFLPLVLVLVAAIFVALRKHYPQTARNLFAVGWFAFYPVWELLVIYLKTENLFDRARATTSWATHDSYLYDPWRWGWAVLALAAFLVQKVWEVRRRPKTAVP